MTGFVVCHSRTDTWGSATVMCLTPVLELQKEIPRKKIENFNVEGSRQHISPSMGREMRVIKEVNYEAFKHLIALPPRQVFILVLLLMSDLRKFLPVNTE